MKAIKLASITLTLSVLGGLLFAAPVWAQDATTTEPACTSPADCMTKGVNSTGGTGGQADLGTVIETITNVLMFIIGAVAVIMIVIGGFMYVTSQGDSSKTTSAKNTILYAVIGLIVALLAYAVVRFVVGQFSAPSTQTSTTTMIDPMSS